MTKIGPGEKNTPCFPALAACQRQASLTRFRPEMKENLYFISISFNLVPKWPPPAGLGEKNTRPSGHQLGEKNTRLFSGLVFFS